MVSIVRNDVKSGVILWIKLVCSVVWSKTYALKGCLHKGGQLRLERSLFRQVLSSPQMSRCKAHRAAVQSPNRRRLCFCRWLVSFWNGYTRIPITMSEDVTRQDYGYPYQAVLILWTSRQATGPKTILSATSTRRCILRRFHQNPFNMLQALTFQQSEHAFSINIKDIPRKASLVVMQCSTTTGSCCTNTYD